VISYSLYLWQQVFLNRYSDQFAYRFPQNLVFVFVAAIFSYTVIERPFLRLKTRLAEGKHGAIERGLESLPVEDSAVSPELKAVGAA
jgi:peptidoglycan/LPS O-acetylase OafA/YrhL